MIRLVVYLQEVQAQSIRKSFIYRTNVIDYVTIASTGNAIDFGDLTIANGFDGASGLVHNKRYYA